MRTGTVNLIQSIALDGVGNLLAVVGRSKARVPIILQLVAGADTCKRRRRVWCSVLRHHHDAPLTRRRGFAAGDSTSPMTPILLLSQIAGCFGSVFAVESVNLRLHHSTRTPDRLFGFRPAVRCTSV